MGRGGIHKHSTEGTYYIGHLVKQFFDEVAVCLHFWNRCCHEMTSRGRRKIHIKKYWFAFIRNNH